MSTKPAAPPPASANVPGAPGSARVHAVPQPPGGGGTAEARSPKAVIPQSVDLEISAGPLVGSDAIVIVGTPKIGKSLLASHLPGAFFLDVEKGTSKLNVSRDDNIPTWPILRGKVAAIAKSPPAGLRSLVLDTANVAQNLASDHVVATRKTGGGKGEGAPRSVASIEEFGWGRGWHYVYDEYDALLADLDRIRMRGIFVCLICHAVQAQAVNPGGEDFIRWEPQLYAGDKNRRASIRDRVFGWADHIVFLDYDLFSKDGKAVGSGTRTIYTQPMATHLAGSRTAQVQIPFDLNDPSCIWRTLGITQSA